MVIVMFFCCFKPYRVSSTNDYKLKPGISGHIYVVKEREFIKTKENIYKIGKSTCIKNRMPSYPKDSSILIIIQTGSYDVHDIEKQFIRNMDKLFIKRTDIGTEYYECEQGEIMGECMLLLNSIHRLRYESRQ